VTVQWRAKPGVEERLAELCDELTDLSRSEAGNHFFEAHRSHQDGRRFNLYAEYADAAGYEAHLASEHYTRLVVGEAIPRLLASRERDVFDSGSRLIDLSSAAPPPPRTRRDAIAFNRVIGTAVVLDLTPVSGRTTIDVAVLERGAAKLQAHGEAIRPGDIVLLRTDWTQQDSGTLHGSPALTHYAARWLLTQRPTCVGYDFFGPEAPVQREILEAGIPLVDGLVNLAELPPRCEFFAPFPSFGEIRATPPRAFAWISEAA
jgi:quinol monooxygenase YgiN